MIQESFEVITDFPCKLLGQLHKQNASVLNQVLGTTFFSTQRSNRITLFQTFLIAQILKALHLNN